MREVTKQPKEKKIKAQSPFPAQLRLYLESGVKVFTLTDATPTLEDMGTHVKVDNREKLQKELMQECWSRASRRPEKGPPPMTDADLQAFVPRKRLDGRTN